MSLKPSLLIIASAFVTLAAAVSACSGQVALDDRPCPCATGWTCCSQKDVCVAPGKSCVNTDSFTTDEAGTLASTHIVARAQSAKCVTSDNGYVYWQNSDGQLVRAPVDGGDLEPSSMSAPGGDNERCGMMVKNLLLYGTQYSAGHIFSTDLVKNADGTFGASPTLLTDANHSPSSLVVDDQSFYVTEYNDVTMSGTVKKYPITASPDNDSNFTTLASGLAMPSALVADDANVYWLNTGDGSIMSAAKAGGGEGTTTAKTVLPSPDSPPPLVLSISNGRLYWATALSIVSANVDGSDVTTLASDIHGLYANAIVADGDFVYWGDVTGIHKVPASGGTAIVISTDVTPTALSVDATRVYWANTKNEIWTALK